MNILFNFNPTDANRPSFFEMFLQSQMMPSLKPAVKYLLSFLSQRFPRLNTAYKYSDELFYATLFILEKHYLNHYDGSFSENMYGLRRTKLLQVDSKQLSRSDKNWSLFFLIVVPYLKDKTDVWFNRNYARNTSLLRAGDIDMDEEVDESVQRRKSRLKRVFDYIISAFYPLFNAFYEGLFFVYQLLYLYHHTPYYTPFLHMQNLVVSRLSQMDYALQQYRTSRPRNETGIKYILTKLLDTWNLSMDFAKYFLPLAVFFFKFLEWWYSEERLSGTVNKPIPPPPELPKQAFSGIPVPDQKKLCPLCRNERENPAIAISGFAFCYPCIYNYVLEHKRCPITLIPSDLDQIRKVYDQND